MDAVDKSAGRRTRRQLPPQADPPGLAPRPAELRYGQVWTP
jgi:hypothetical protein